MLQVKARGCLIIGDNGNFSRMSTIAAPFLQRGTALLQLAQAAQLRSGKVPPSLVHRRDNLMRDIIQACDGAFRATDWSPVGALINEQPYTSKSPYFRSFEEQFPSNWSGLRRKLRISKLSTVADVATLLQSRPA